jgi:hypothetical protein
MLAASPRTLLALDLVGPVEAKPAQLIRSSAKRCRWCQTDQRQGHAGSGWSSRDGVDQRCITRHMLRLLGLGDASTS